jgi:cell division protein FtsB
VSSAEEVNDSPEPRMDDLSDNTEAALRRRKRRRILFWSVIGLAVLTLVTGNYGAFQIYRLNREKAELEQEIERLKKEQEALIRNRERLKNDISYIEKVAREKYRMVREGEQVYQVIPKKDKEKQE